jgi:hypothetical protein
MPSPSARLCSDCVFGNNHFFRHRCGSPQTPATAPQNKLTSASTSNPASVPDVVVIPGPLRSFLRMAAISQKAAPEEVLPLLAEMVMTKGYSDGRPTEFLVLLKRYLRQATELAELAQPEGVIRVVNCNQAKPLLAILGYQLRSSCGPGVTLQTADPARAFLTIDSGFPLADLEQAIREDKPFSLPFSSTQLPALFASEDWNAISGTPQAFSLLDSLLLRPGRNSHLCNQHQRSETGSRFCNRFQRMTRATGGEVYFAKSWKRQQEAFASVREDIGHLYSLSYYPKNNSNRGWRSIEVKLTGSAAKKYHVRTRSGYRPRLTRVITPAP